MDFFPEELKGKLHECVLMSLKVLKLQSHKHHAVKKGLLHVHFCLNSLII